MQPGYQEKGYGDELNGAEGDWCEHKRVAFGAKRWRLVIVVEHLLLLLSGGFFIVVVTWSGGK